MRSSQLERALRTHRETRDVFVGVFASDQLPVCPRQKKPLALIVNTDPSHKPGLHWCAFYITTDCVYYFDPYGIPPLVKSFQTLLKCRRRNEVFGKRLQGRGSVCGHYCMYYILAMVRGKDFDLFGDDLNANDRIVRNVVTSNFRVT